MRIVRKIKRFFTNLVQKQQAEDTLNAELRAYVDEVAEHNLRRGMHPEEARRQALVEIGGVEQIKEEVREAWLGQSVETTMQDIRSAYHSLRRSPGFTAVVVTTLSLGIGASLTMFSTLQAVLWRPLPYPEPNQIVTIQVDARNVPHAGATKRELLGFQERSRSFEQVSTMDQIDANLEYAGAVERVMAAYVSDDFLPLLGVYPALGRTLNSRLDAGQQQAFAIVISDDLWRRRFSADRHVIGKSVRIDDLDRQIVGVLPPGFRLLLPPSVSDAEQIDVWLPDRIDPTIPYRGVPLVARLRPGVTLLQANAELQTLAAQFEREYPDFYSGSKAWQASPSDRKVGTTVHFTARRLHEEMTRDARPALFLLSGAVGFVLLIACVNVAHLLLARGAARQREFEIRRALGAARTRLLRQLLTESLVLAVMSGVIGLFCAHFGLAVIAHQSAAHLPLQSRIGIDTSVTGFALLLSVTTSLLFGLLPAWRLTSGQTGAALRAGRTETAGAGARRWQRTLVVAEVALSIMPLVGGGLLLRSFLNLLHTPLGFHPAHVVTARVPLDFKRYPKPEQRWALVQNVLDQVRALPVVQTVSAADPLPLAGQARRRVGRADQPNVPPILATQQFALPGYLGVIGTPLREGRDFTEQDRTAQPGKTILDEGLAKRLWPEGAAVGKMLSVYRTGWQNNLEVVGITSGVRVTRVRDENVPHFMLPYDGGYPSEISLVIRTPEKAERIASRIRAAVEAAHTGRAAYEIRPMSDYVSDSIGDTRFLLFMLATFAGASVLLVAVGLYGTLAYLTAQRTREFGIRLALGSSVRAILMIPVQESVLLAMTGTVLGLLGAAVLTRAIQQMLFGVQPLDAVTLVSVVGLVAIVALGAASVPAWRATRIDPQTSLRSE